MFINNVLPGFMNAFILSAFTFLSILANNTQLTFVKQNLCVCGKYIFAYNKWYQKYLKSPGMKQKSSVHWKYSILCLTFCWLYSETLQIF